MPLPKKKIEFVTHEIPGFTQSRQDLEAGKSTIESYIVNDCGGQRSKNDIRSVIPRLDGAVSCLGAIFGYKVNRNNSFTAAYWMSPGQFFKPHDLLGRNADKVILYFFRPSTVQGFLQFNSDVQVNFNVEEQLAVLFNGDDNWETDIAVDAPDTLLIETIIYKCK